MIRDPDLWDASTGKPACFGNFKDDHYMCAVKCGQFAKCLLNTKEETNMTTTTKKTPVTFTTLGSCGGDEKPTVLDRVQDALTPAAVVFVDEAGEAAWRTVADQYKETIRVPFVAALCRNLGLGNGRLDKVIRSKVAQFVETDLGDAVFTYALSFTTQFVSYKRNIALRMARELRIAGKTKLLNKVANTFFGPMRAALDEVIRGGAVPALN